MTSRKSIVSSVLPCYNNDRYVGQAIESLLEQKRAVDEIIVIDDGSTDSSWEVIQELVSTNTQVKAFKNEKNLGIPATRNRLIQEMRGDADYMLILDADDVAAPGRVARQLEYLENHPDCALVGSDISIINEQGEQIGVREYPHTHEEIVSSALHFNPFAQSSVMIRTSVIGQVGEYDERLARVQDYDLWLRVIKAGYQVHNLVEPLTLFRRHKDQGKETMAQKSIYYSWRVRARYIWRPRFFSLKGVALFVAYTLAMIFPKQMLNKIYAKLFVQKHDQNK
jgi:glycosyltransferase involved in cell wall biosynthesis